MNDSLRKALEERTKIKNKRDQEFIANLVEAAAKHGGFTNEALVEASEHTYALGYARDAHLRKGRQKLGLSKIREGIASFYELTADFSLEEAAALHVAHIRGGLKYREQVIDKEGVVHTLEHELPPSYPALKEFMKYTVEPPKQTENKNFNLNANVESGPYQQPEIGAREIGENKDG